jgi:hypothetical protein
VSRFHFSSSDDPRYLGTVKVEYPVHPLCGQEVRAVQCDAIGRKGKLLAEASAAELMHFGAK